MVKTYILAPNWTTAPPPTGPIKLGHILDDLTEFVPLNRATIVEIPKSDLNPVDTKHGFSASRSRLVSGELGFFARVLGLVGFGAEAAAYYKKDENDVLSCKKLHTMTFDPTATYIAKSLELPDVKKFMEKSKFKFPLYMVTGLKVARGGSLQSSSSNGKGLTLEGGLKPPESPAQFGIKGGVSVASADGLSWKGSSDFIMAFRVRKIWYSHGQVNDETYKNKAVMMDGKIVRSQNSLVLMSDDDVPLEDVSVESRLTKDKEVENGEEVFWVVPEVTSDLKQTAQDSTG